MFIHYKMQDTSTRKDEINHLTINVCNTMTNEVIGTARMTSLEDVYLELPEKQGRYTLRTPALRQLAEKNIKTLADLYRYKWLVSDGGWILLHLKEAK